MSDAPAHWPDSLFAYVPSDGGKSDRKLPLSDDGSGLSADRIHAAWQALTAGIRGNKADIPDSDMADVKGKIKAAADKLPDGDAKQSILDYINSKGTASAKAERERNIAIKSLDDDWRIGGYLVLYGDAKQTDLTGDWFTKSTDLGLDWYGKLPILFEHSLDKTVKAVRVGTIDTIETDEYGVWVEGYLDKARDYAKRVRDLVKKDATGFSSGSLQHIVRRKNDVRSGEITQWPIAEASVTVTPAEPRMMVTSLKHYAEPVVVQAAYKAMNLDPDRWLIPSEEPAEDRLTRDRGDSKAEIKTTGTQKEKINVTPEEIQALINAALAKQAQEVTAAKALIDAQEAAIKAEVDKRVALLTPTPQPTKALPPSGVLPASQEPPAVKANPQLSMIGDRRYQSLSSVDLSLLADVYGAIYEHGLRRGSYQVRGNDLKPVEKAAKAFWEQMGGEDRRMQREISAKAIKEVARKQADPTILDYIPYRDLDAVDSNRYDENAMKSLREEIAASRRDDRSVDGIKSNELDNTGQSNYGAEWVPTIWNNVAWNRVRINNPMTGTIQTVQMPSNPWNWPIESTDPTTYFIAEGTDASQLVLGSGNTLALSKAGTGKVPFTAKKLGSHIGFSQEENEDSIIPVVPIWRYQVMRTISNAVDNTIINGDTATTASTNINLIDGTPSTTASYMSMDGIRKYALVTNTAQGKDFGGAAPTLTNLRAMRKLLANPYGADIANLVYVTSMEVYYQMLAMPEYNVYINAGIPPTSQTGMLPRGSADQVGVMSNGLPAMPFGYIDGIPTYVSAELGLSKSNGKISTTGSNNIYGSVLLYHRTRWGLGYRRAINVELLQTSVFSDTWQIWGTVRFALQSFDTQSASVGYDIGV